MEWFDWLMIAAWIVIFLATLIIEIETSNLTTIWFCIAAIITLILTISIPWVLDRPLMQVAIFVAAAGTLLAITLPLMRKVKRTDFIPTNSDKIIGKIGIVTKEITPNEIGEIKVDNTLWRAINNDGLTFQIGEEVHIDNISGIKAIVSRLDDESSPVHII